MNLYLAGPVAGAIASLAWSVANLLADGAFFPIIRRHSHLMNESLMARPLLNLLVLVVDLAVWGALFGMAYALVEPAFVGWTPLAAGVVWGLIMFVSFSRGMVESLFFTRLPKDMNVFFFFEGLAGLLAWGASFGVVFRWLT